LSLTFEDIFMFRESESEYRDRAKTHLTSHALAEFRRCPLLYWRRKQGLVPDEDRPAYLVGRAAHTLILEGRKRFDAMFAVGGPINEKTGKPYGAGTKAWTEWAANVGKDVLTEEQYALVTNLAAAVAAHPVARELLADGVPEGVVRVEYHGLPCQARIDFFNPEHGLIDLKTCDDLTWFEADARRFTYAHQFAFYQALVHRATGEEVPVHAIAVEKKEPYRAGVWLLSEQTLTVARRENEIALERLKACELSGAWPTGYEERRVFDYL
jgi:hypothetical protein